jgi:hypothetical protein
MDNGTSLGVFYYSRQEDAGNNLFRYYGRVASISGTTVTFDPSFAVSDVASLPEFGRDGVVNSVYMGDYNQAVGINGVYHLSWADNRSDLAVGPPRKDPNVYYDKVSVVPPQISVNPTSLVINVPFGGTGSTTFDISNTVVDAGSLVWSISTGGCTWISSVSPSSGSTAGGASTTVTVNVDATGLNCGAYNCTLTITSNASNSPSLNVPVQLNVQSALSCSITSVPENNVYTGGNPNNIYLGYGPQKTTLQSSVSGGAGPFTYSWSPSTGLSSATSAAPVFTPTSAGTYVFTLTVTGPGGCQTTCNITINVYDIRVPGTNGKKIYLCHAPPDNPSNTQTLQISVNAVPGHMPAHPDDHLGPCSLVIAPRGSEFDVIAAGASIRTFPNPNKGSFELMLDNFSPGKAEVRIMNIDGTIVERRSINISATSQSLNFELKNKAAGMYYVQVVSAGRTQNVKFVINR